MSDAHTWNHLPVRRPDPPAPTLIRTLWVMVRPPNKTVTAGVYQHRYGRELRVHYGENINNIVMTELSRTGEGPLEFRASELRAVLEQVGWRIDGA